MNVAALLQDSPSDDRRRQQQEREQQQQQQQQQQRQQQQQQREHDQQRQHHDQQQQQQQQRVHHSPHERNLDRLPPQHLSPPHAQPPQPPLRRSSPVHRLGRPPTPPHHAYAQGDYSRGAPLPPPSSILPSPREREYEHKHRRSNPEALMPHPHDLSLHTHQGLGPPGPQPPPYILDRRPHTADHRPPNVDHRQPNVDHRSLADHRPLASLPPPPRLGPSHSHSHSQSHPHQHAHTLPSTPSAMYMQPLSRPAPIHSASTPNSAKHGPGSSTSPPSQGIPPSHSHPLLPMPVGPGVAQPRHRSPGPFMDPSPMYGAHPQPHPGHIHPSQLTPGPASGAPGHRQRSSFDYTRDTSSPAMGSLQRPPSGPYDEREREPGRHADRDARDREQRPRGPSSAMGGPPPGSVPSLSHQHPPTSSMSMGHLPGPGARPVAQPMLAGPGVMPAKDPPRERERVERERTADAGAIARLEREREREAQRERERWERAEREKERERGERERERVIEQERREMELRMAHGPALAQPVDPIVGGVMPPADVDAHYRRHQPPPPRSREQPPGPQGPGHGPGQQWSRFAQRIGPEDDRERERMLVREMDNERERVRRLAEAEDSRRRDASLDAERERATRLTQRRSSGKEKELRREKEERRASNPAREERVDERENAERRRWTDDQVERHHPREHRERERNEDPLRPRQPHASTEARHVHEHHHMTTASSHGRSSSKSKNGSGPVPMAQPIVGPGVPPSEGQSFPTMQERQHQATPVHRQSSRNGPNGAQQSHAHLQHTLSHQLASVAYSHRRTPPPVSIRLLPPSSGVPPGATVYVQSRPSSPRPQVPPLIQPLHLGTFVFPRIPFPYTDFPNLSTETGAHGLPPPDATHPHGLAPEREPRELHATIFIPSGFLPAKLPVRVRLWGGGPQPVVRPLPPAQPLPGHPPRQQFELLGSRRVYTDDSDLVMCALHSGFVSWPLIRRARRERRDLKMEVKISREARFVGGVGSPFRVKRKRVVDDEDIILDEEDSAKLKSASWGNGHDGAGIEVLVAEFVEPGSAHSSCLRNRNQRLLEYAERGAAFRPRKRKRALADESEPWQTSRKLPFGDGTEWNKLSTSSPHTSETPKPMVSSSDVENDPPSTAMPDLSSKEPPVESLTSLIVAEVANSGQGGMRGMSVVAGSNAGSKTPADIIQALSS